MSSKQTSSKSEFEKSAEVVTEVPAKQLCYVRTQYSVRSKPATFMSGWKQRINWFAWLKKSKQYLSKAWVQELTKRKFFFYNNWSNELNEQ